MLKQRQIHQWLGRAIALLALAQIPLGLTLYGSPKSLFILYAFAVFAWVLLWFILSAMQRPYIGGDYSEDGSYISGPTRTEVTQDRRSRSRESHHRLRNAGIIGAGLAGLAALRRRSRSQDQSRRQEGRNGGGRPEVISSRRNSRSRIGSGSYVENEKYSDDGRGQRQHSWRNRLLGAGAGLGAYEGIKRLLNRRKDRDEESETGYTATLGGNQSISRTDVSRVNEGQAPLSPPDPRFQRRERIQNMEEVASPTRQGLRPRRDSADSFSSHDSRESWEGTQNQRPQRITDGRSHGIRDGIATLGVLGFAREWSKRRREGKEERRIEEMRRHEEENAERINRANSRRQGNNVPGLGYPSGRPNNEQALPGATQDFGMSGSNTEFSRLNRPDPNAPPLPASAGVLPPVAGASRHNLTETGYNQPGHGGPSYTNLPPPPPGPYPTSAGAGAGGPVSMPSPAMHPSPSRLTNSDHHLADATAAGLAAGTAAGLANHTRHPSHSRSPTRPGARYHDRRPTTSSSRRNSYQSGTGPTTPGTASVTSPASQPVSVKVKMHNDGRHVTLRRLNEEEAAAERAARRAERRKPRRRAESLSSVDADNGGRFRRNDNAIPNAPAPLANPGPGTGPGATSPYELNLPPPVPQHSSPGSGAGAPKWSPPSAMAGSGMSGLGSGGVYGSQVTDGSRAEDNRRRRRAERAARAQRAGGGPRVEFE